MALGFDRWDPEDSLGFNKSYSYDTNTGAFRPGEGNFVKYNNSSRAANNIVDHIYWDPTTSAVYYKHPDTGKYTQAAVGDLDVSGGVFSYLSDDQLDKIAQKIYSDVSTERDALRRQQIEERNQQTTGILNIPTPTPDSKDSIQQKEYEKRKADANALLQKMMIEDPDVTPEEDNTVYYKYGPDEVDLKYYLHNIGTNLQGYLQSQDWSQAQKNAFINSYNNYKQALQEQLDSNSGRFSTDDAGMIIDSQNLLSGDQGVLIIDENGNIYNSYEEIPDKKLRRTAVEFSPNQEVNNYLSTIGQAIVESGKTRKSSSKFDGDFDLNKHGFINYWVNKINPSGGNPDIDPYLALDPVSPTGKRERTNRTKYLAHQLSGYLKQIKNSKTNFENSSFKTKDAYIQKVQQAIDNLNNGWDTTDAASLQAIGITPEFYSALMTEQSNPLMSEQELSAEMEKRKAEAASEHIDKVQQIYNNFASNPNAHTENNPVRVIKDSRYDPKTEGGLTRIQTALSNLGLPVTDRSSLANSVDSLWEQVKYALRSGEQTININGRITNINEILSIILPLEIETGAFSEADNKGVRYHNDDINDLQQGAILCYKDGKLYFDFIENHKSSNAWQRLKSEFEKNYVVQNSDKPKHSFDKLGGVLKKLQEGGNINPEEFDEETLAQLQQLQAMTTQPTTSLAENAGKGTAGELLADAIFGPREAAAQAHGLSLERYNQKQRTPNGQPDAFNKDNGIWKTEDYVRLGAIAADIASLVMDPVTGAVTNVGSTATNFLADWADNSVTATEMWKNLGMNLGMDALSIVPIVGDAAGTGSKLIKSVKTIAPKLMYGLTAWGILGTLKNGSNIMESFNKVMSDEKLTVGDWQNIAQAITAVAGVNGAVKSGVAKKLAKNRALDSDAIGLGLKDKNGNVQDYIFRGDKAKELKTLVAEGDISKVNAKIKELEGFSDFEINTSLNTVPLSVGLPVGRTVGADGKKSWGTKNPFNVKRTMDTFEIFDPSKLRGGYASRNLLNTNRQDAITGTSRDFSSDQLLTPQQIEAQRVELFNKAAEESGAIAFKERKARQAELTKQRITDVEAAEAVAKTNLQNAKAITAVQKQRLAELQSKYKVGTSKDTLTDLDAALKKIRTSKKTRNATQVDSRLEEIEAELTSKKRLRQALSEQFENLKNSNASTKRVASKNKEIEDLDEVLKNFNEEKAQLIQWKQDRADLETIKQELQYISGNGTNPGTFEGIQELQFQKELDAYNPQLKRLRDTLQRYQDRIKDPLTNTTPSKSLQELLTRLNGNNTITIGGTERDVSDLLKKSGFLKHGGRLKSFNDYVVKAQHGVQLKSNNGWYNDVFSGYEQTILDRIAKNPDYYKTINDKQREHYGLYTDANASGDWTKKAYTGKNNSVGNYQTWYNDEDFNTLGITPNFESRYDFNPATKRTSMDRPGTYKSDNLYSSITDDRRVLGRKGDWSDAQVDDFNSKLKSHGLEMTLGEGDYYYINPITAPTTSSNQNPQQPSPTPVKPTQVNLNLIEMPQQPRNSIQSSGKRGTSPKQGSRFGKNLPGILENLPDAMSLLRYHLLSNANKRATKQALEGEVTYYQSPKNDNVFVYGDNKALADGEKDKANLMSTGYNHVLTSDGAQQMAFIKDLHLKGQEYVNAGRDKDNQMWRTTQQMDLAQRKENHTNEHMVAEQNKLSAIKTIKNKSDIKKALTAQLANDRDIMLQEWQYKIKKNQAEKKALNEAATESRIKLAVQNNPNKYGAGLSSQELAVYNRAMAGTAPSSMSQKDIALLASANKKLQLAMQNQYYAWKGISPDPWTEDANKTRKSTTTFTPKLLEISKNGSKLAIAKIRNKAKNADRFQKSILKQIESLDKKLDRISRSMYSLPKSEVVKPK